MVSPSENRVSPPNTKTSNTKQRKRRKLSLSSSSPATMEDLVQEREELMVNPSKNIVSSSSEQNTKQRKRTKLSLSSSSPSTMEDLVEEREDLMVFPSSSLKTHLLKPCFTASIEGSQAKIPPTDLKALSLSVSFNGWRFPTVKFKSWATNMSVLYEPIWKEAGILEAVAASTVKISKDSELVMGLAEKWCPETKTFVFLWGEATITLEDVMLLLGFSVLGSPVFAALDSSEEKILGEIKKDRVNFVTKVAWMGVFMDCGDELEHAAFLALWLSYFVFPSRYYHIDKSVLRIAVHLSSGTRIALAPAVLAHLYAHLTLLKHHTRAFSIDKIELNALFKLVQVWTWERFRELQPKPNLLIEGQPRLTRWDEVEHGNVESVRQVLDNSKSFEWRPYTKAVENWELLKFYPEKDMWVLVGPYLDEDFISFARCIKASELVGIDCVEHYFPNRVALQFGLVQDVPSTVNRNNVSEEEAWSDYNKPIEELTLFIPSRSARPRVTSMFCDWWKESFPQLLHSLKEKCVVVESSETLKPRNIIGGDCDDASTSGSRKRRCRKRVCTMGHCQAHDNEDENLSLTIAQIRRLSIKNCSDDASELLGKKSRFEQGSDEAGSRSRKDMFRSQVEENNSSDPPLGFDDDILVSPPPETRQTCDDELDVHGSNVEKMNMPTDGNKEPECLLHEDGGMAGEKASSEKIASNADNNETTPCQNLAFGGSEVAGELDSGNARVDEAQGHGCLFHDTVLGSEETIKSSEQLENVGGNDSFEKSLHNVKVMALPIEERIIKLQRNVAWLKARKATKQKKIAAASRLI